MEPNAERRRENLVLLQDAYKKVLERLGEEKRSTVLQSRDTMKDLALVLGTFAAGSLVLLTAPIPKVIYLIIIGIILLVFEAFWIFKYLFGRIEAETNSIEGVKKDILEPLAQGISLYRKAKKVTYLGRTMILNSSRFLHSY